MKRSMPFALTVAILCGLWIAASVAADTDGLTEYDVAKLVSLSGGVISPDGTHVAYLHSIPRNPFEEDNGPAWRELHVLSPDGETRPYVSGDVSVRGVSWSPDGSLINFLSKRKGDDDTALYTIPLAGGEARRVLAHEGGVNSYSFSPDASKVAFLARRDRPEEREELIDKGFDAEIYEEELRPVEVWVAEIGDDGKAGEAKALELGGSATLLSWSPAGDKLVLALAPTPLIDDEYMQRKVKVVDAGSGEIEAEIANTGKLGTVRWSPDGRHLALITASDFNDPSAGRLAVVPASGGTPTDILPGYLGQVVAVSWLDADNILFIGHEGVRAGLQRIGRGGGTPQALVPAGEPIWTSVSVSRDGSQAALIASDPQHPSELYTWSVGTGAPERRTDSNPWLAEKRLARQEVVTWTARDGLELEGVLTWPLDYVEGQRYPLILSVHGGPEAHEINGWMTNYGDPGQVAAARGMAVFNPNYRGSTAYGVEFSKLSQGDPAGKEFDDLVDAVEHFVASGLADRDKIGITGGSYGGYATGWASTFYSEHFAAGVMFVGISEKIAKAGTTDIPNEEHAVHARVWPWEKWQFMLERSPVYHVEKSQTPLLILHGKEDSRVHPSQSMILYRFLKTLGQAPVRLVFYPGEGHGNRKAAGRLDYNLRMMRWFEHYLLGEGGEAPPAELDPRPPEMRDDDEDDESMEVAQADLEIEDLASEEIAAEQTAAATDDEE